METENNSIHDTYESAFIYTRKYKNPRKMKKELDLVPFIQFANPAKTLKELYSEKIHYCGFTFMKDEALKNIPEGQKGFAVQIPIGINLAENLPGPEYCCLMLHDIDNGDFGSFTEMTDIDFYVNKKGKYLMTKEEKKEKKRVGKAA